MQKHTVQRVNANGAQIPTLGFGKFELEPADAEAMVEHALKVDYRHIKRSKVTKDSLPVFR
jgi:diketogulonate reductase-like aldo/keto reductase